MRSLVLFQIVLLLNSLTSSAQIVSSSWDNCSKYLGNISRDLSSSNITITPPNWLSYWNQVTPSNAGKWGFVEGQRDVMRWDGLDKAYSLAKDNGLKFKQHTLIWGNQQPTWMDGLSAEEQLEEIEEWVSQFCARYPDTDQIDVVNEARTNKPDGGKKNDGSTRANYIDALGGLGDTGVDWVIKAFEIARKYCPNADLILNDYGILNNPGNRNDHIALANILNNRGLIDGIGVQGHSFTIENMTVQQMEFALDQLGETGLPIYISELDIDAEGQNPENTQLLRYQKLFPVMWEHPDVAGITLWGYVKNNMWRETAYLVHGEEIGAEERSALQWIRSYVNKTNSGCDNTGPILSLEFQDFNLNLYPNPVRSGSVIKFSGEEVIDYISLKTIRGETINSYDINSKEGVIKVNLGRGVYLILIKNDKGRKYYRKLVVN